MPSLLQLVERVNKSLPVEPVRLEIYEKSDNAAEAFLSNRASATLKLRQAQGYLRKCLEAIDFADSKVLLDYLSVCGLLDESTPQVEPAARFGAARIARKDYSLGIEAIQSAAARDLAEGGKFLAGLENCLWVASQYQYVAEEMGWSTPEGHDWENGVIRLGFVVSKIDDRDSASQMLVALAENLHPAALRVLRLQHRGGTSAMPTSGLRSRLMWSRARAGGAKRSSNWRGRGQAYGWRRRTATPWLTPGRWRKK